jgi:hypothetical protein
MTERHERNIVFDSNCCSHAFMTLGSIPYLGKSRATQSTMWRAWGKWKLMTRTDQLTQLLLSPQKSYGIPSTILSQGYSYARV